MRQRIGEAFALAGLFVFALIPMLFLAIAMGEIRPKEIWGWIKHRDVVAMVDRVISL